MARRPVEMNAGIDIRVLLGRIQTPCLVVVRTEDVWLSAGNSRYLAEHIPGAQLLELPGVDHDPWMATPSRSFRRSRRSLPRSSRPPLRLPSWRRTGSG